MCLSQQNLRCLAMFVGSLDMTFEVSNPSHVVQMIQYFNICSCILGVILVPCVRVTVYAVQALCAQVTLDKWDVCMCVGMDVPTLLRQMVCMHVHRHGCSHITVLVYGEDFFIFQLISKIS